MIDKKINGEIIIAILIAILLPLTTLCLILLLPPKSNQNQNSNNVMTTHSPIQVLTTKPPSSNTRSSGDSTNKNTGAATATFRPITTTMIPKTTTMIPKTTTMIPTTTTIMPITNPPIIPTQPPKKLNSNFFINNVNTTGSINYTYNMSTGVYSFDFSNSEWNSIKLQLYGAGGGNDKGGTGGYVEGVINLSTIPSKKFYVIVGTAGGIGTTQVGNVIYTTGGINGGGRGVNNILNANTVGGGGGATDLRLVYSNNIIDYDNSQRILVAGGGGGGTSNSGSDTIGGNAGYPNAPNVINSNYGGADGGTQSNGGALGGKFGFGGENPNNTGWNGGGGGGYYGGGACKVQHGAGAGGSGYYNPSYVTSFKYETNGGGSKAQENGKAILTIISN